MSANFSAFLKSSSKKYKNEMLLEARDGRGDQEWWGGDASGPNQTLYLERFGYEAGDPAVPVVMTWDLQGASGWRYTLYDDSSGQWIELVSGADYAVEVPAGGVTLRLFAEGGPLPVPPDFDGATLRH